MFKTKFSYKNLLSLGNLILLDQIIVSGGNFLFSILVISFLGVKIFGIYSFFWLFILFVLSLQTSLIISPMFSNTFKYDPLKIDYFYGAMLLKQVLFSILIFLLFYLFGDLINKYLIEYNFFNYLISFSSALIVMQFYNFLRRVYFNKQFIKKIIFIDLLIYSLSSLLIFYLEYNKIFSLVNLFWLFTFTFSIGILLSFKIIFQFKIDFNFFLKTVNNNWIISKWLFLTTIAQWLSGNLWIINAGIILGPFKFGIIRACQTLLSLTNIFFQTFENFVPATTTKIYKKKGLKEMNKYLKIFRNKYLFLVNIFIFLIILMSKFLLNVFFGQEISNYYYILIVLALLIPINFLQYPFIFGLRTMDFTKPILIAYVFSSLLGLFFSNIIITNYGIYGLLLGLYSSQILTTYILYKYYNKVLKKIII